jgi:hypothetical protein
MVSGKWNKAPICALLGRIHVRNFPFRHRVIRERRRRNVMERRPGGEVIETAREARQGYLDRPVLLVLVVSTALAVLILGILWLGMWPGAA